MKYIIAALLIFVLPTLALAEGGLPTPDYHRQSSDSEWLVQVVQFHGHLGPSVVAGARMGMIGLRALQAKGYFDVEVTCEGPMANPPQSCLLDGIQATTGATLGKRTLTWTQADQIVVRIRNTRTGETAELRPTPALMELLGSFKAQPKPDAKHRPGQQDHERLEAIARKIAAMPEKEVASVTMIATKEGIAVDDLYGLVKDHPEYWSNDGVHFNGKGVAVEAEQVAKRIMESLKKIGG